MVPGSLSDAGGFSVPHDAVCALLGYSDLLQNNAAGSEPCCPFYPAVSIQN